jgi:HAMP domain-containing protein
MWTAVSYGINHLKSGDETAAMMAEDLQSYQAHTADTFDSLMQGRAAADISPLYQSFLEQQEERLFLCDLLANFLSDQMIQQYPSIMRDSHSYLALFLGILLCLLLLTAYFSYTFTRSVCHPVQKLVDQAGELMEGNYQTPDLKSAEQDEIGYLTHAFNEMKHQILENFQSKEQLWHVESLLKDAEYRALQSQINPHFLSTFWLLQRRRPSRKTRTGPWTSSSGSPTCSTTASPASGTEPPWRTSSRPCGRTSFCRSSASAPGSPSLFRRRRTCRKSRSRG